MEGFGVKFQYRGPQISLIEECLGVFWYGKGDGFGLARVPLFGKGNFKVDVKFCFCEQGACAVFEAAGYFLSGRERKAAGDRFGVLCLPVGAGIVDAADVFQVGCINDHRGYDVVLRLLERQRVDKRIFAGRRQRVVDFYVYVQRYAELGEEHRVFES